ncbi:MAG: circularly permuted type 2 ATP-grasp protein, partial [Roseimicrobium sp.]
MESLAAPASVSGGDLLVACRSKGAGYDEAFAPDGTPRPAWLGLCESLAKLRVSDLNARRDDANRLLRDHGATYTIYGDTQAVDRHWRLDILPLIIGVEEWRTLESGLKQRSRLLRALVSDVYGERR